jgi:hypothetical protein
MSTPSLLNVPYRLKAGTLYSQIPETGAGDFVVSRTTSPTANRSTRVNADGFIELVNDNVPRLDYPLGGAVNGCAALLVEPAATNGIRNNSMVGAVAGTPGNLPTNWSNTGSGLTRQSIVTGTLNGIPYVDIRISGTANNTFHDVFWDTSNIIAASVGQNWVASCYLQIIAQPNPPVNYTLAMREFNSGGGFLGVFTGPALSISTTSFNRFSFTRALNQATVAFVHPSLFLTLVNGQTYDFTIRIGYPQMEIGLVATSVIPTTTASITRGNEIMTRASATALIGQSEGSIYWDIAAVGGVLSGTGNPEWGVRNEATTNFIGLTSNGTASPFRISATATVGSLINYQANITSGKAALAWSSAGLVLYVNGVQVATSATNPNFSFTRADIRGVTMPFKANAFALYPNRLSNTELIALTT